MYGICVVSASLYRNPSFMKSRSSKGHKNYDLILREHIEKFVLSIGTVLFGLDIASTVRLETSLRKVVSRDVDSLFQIRTHDGRELILHVEFQSSDDPDMVYRMASYRALLQGTYRQPVIQYVIYLGRGESKMQTNLEREFHITGFQLLNLSTIDYREFLSLLGPEEIALSILGDFGELSPDEAVEEILKMLHKKSETPKELEKSIEQLLIFSQLRNLTDIVEEKTSHMPITIDLTENALYKKGEAKGEARGEARGEVKGRLKANAENQAKNRRTMLRLMRSGQFTHRQLAEYFEMEEEELRLQLTLAEDEEKLG